MRKCIGLLAAVMALTGFAADAEDRPAGSRPTEAPLLRGAALEIGFAVGSDQVYGSLGAGLQALGEMGAALELEVALRIDPRWAVGAHASGSVYSGARTFGRGAAAGLHVTRRFLPHRPVQPWISVGAGWRAQWLSAREGDGPCHGVELVRLRVGVDEAVTSRMSLSPVLGVAAATFLSYGDAGHRRDVRGLRPSLIVFAGLMSRF